MEHVICGPGLDTLLGVDTNIGPRTFDTAKAAFEEAGFHVVVLDFPGKDNVYNAHMFKSAIAALPSTDRVHVVGHSMGGLSARKYVQDLGGAGRVSTYVAIDTPQFGTPKAWLPWIWCLQITPLASFIRALNQLEAPPTGTAYVQLTCEYQQLLPGAKTKHLPDVSPNVDHRNAIVDAATLDLVLRAIQGDLAAFEEN